MFTRASAAADRFGKIDAHEKIRATVRTADGFFGFDPGVAQAGNVGLFRMRWVLKTTDVTASSHCSGLPLVTPPIAGVCYAMVMADVSVRASARSSAPVLATLRVGDFAMVRRHPGRWYELDLNVGSTHQDRLGYLKESELDGLSGPCQGL